MEVWELGLSLWINIREPLCSSYVNYITAYHSFTSNSSSPSAAWSARSNIRSEGKKKRRRKRKEKGSGNTYKVWSTTARHGSVHTNGQSPLAFFLNLRNAYLKLHLHCKGQLGASSQPPVLMSCTFYSSILILTVTYWETAFSAKSSSPSVTRPLSNVWQFACVAQSAVNQSFFFFFYDRSEWGKKLKTDLIS